MSNLIDQAKENKDRELIAQHKKLLEQFMKNELDWKYRDRKKILTVYDSKIVDHNIRFYYNRPMRLFLIALLKNKLSSIANYYPKDYGFNREENKMSKIKINKNDKAK